MCAPTRFRNRSSSVSLANGTDTGGRRNLVVAATGTGKTMIAAFDFARLQRDRPNARLLFVAHRKEIFARSRRLFRLVLRSPQFGGLLVAGGRPTDDRHVFASIQSLSQIDLSAELAPEHYDVVIVDEFHHAEAPTYQRLLDHLRPWTLLGLTATPERSDGQDILHWFDGRIAAELRLWDALEQGHLCPFQYFGVGDNVDLVGVQWRRGGYAVAEIDNLYTGNDRRVQTILLAIERLIRDPEHMRALGFCVSVAHADFMAKRFSEKGIAATAVTGSTPPEERSVALERLRNGQIQVIFSVDVLNEGLDIPDIDTVLFLRPTESATVFLQQLGRGLRKASGKSGLTVLDFVGRQHAQFRFEPRFAALTNTTGRRLERAIEHDFPFLPSGCAIHLDPVAREIVLTNVKRSIAARSFNALASDLKRHGDISLRAFLSAEEIALDDIYRSKAGWSRLREQAGFIGDLGPSGSGLANAVGRMRHIHDSLRLETYRRWLVEPHPPRVDRLGKADRRLLHMLVASLYGSQPFADEAAALAHLWPHEAIRRELCDLFDVLDDQSELLDVPYDDPEVPLCVHGTYSRPEILAAFGDWRVAKPPSVREGVRYLAESASDLFWITLNKDPERYIPSTMYRDYPISRELFHWESQSTTTSRSATGQRYIHHVERGSRVCLFVRTEPENAAGIAFAFTFLGTARYVSHHGDRPMKITWRLDRPMPADLFVAGRAVA